MFRKFLLVISLCSFFWINLLPTDNNRLNFDKIGVNKIVNKKIIKLSKEVSNFISSSKFNLSKIESLLDSFSSILKSSSSMNLKPSEVRLAKKYVNDLELLINEILAGDIHKNDRCIMEKILKLLSIFKILLDNSEIVDNSVWTLCLDRIYHKPVEFIGKHKVGTSIFLILAALSGSGFNYFKKSEKNNDDVNLSGLIKNNPDNDLLINGVVTEDSDIGPNIVGQDPLLIQSPLGEEVGLNTQEPGFEFPSSDILDVSGYDDYFYETDEFVPTNISSVSTDISLVPADIPGEYSSSDLDLDDSDEVDDDRPLFARETNTRYNFRDPALKMSSAFRRKIGTGSNLGAYKRYLRLFD